MGVWSLSQWTMREVPPRRLLNSNLSTVSGRCGVSRDASSHSLGWGDLHANPESTQMSGHMSQLSGWLGYTGHKRDWHNIISIMTVTKNMCLSLRNLGVRWMQMYLLTVSPGPNYQAHWCLSFPEKEGSGFPLGWDVHSKWAKSVWWLVHGWYLVNDCHNKHHLIIFLVTVLKK